MGMSARSRRRLLVGLVVVLAVVSLYLATSGPVLFSFSPRAVASPTPLWSLLNPLRDRGPERPAQALLHQLKAGNAREAFAALRLEPPLEPAAVDGEQRIALLSWRLVGRKDLPDRTELVYKCARADRPGDPRRPVWITVERESGNGPWRVVSYSAFY